VRGLYFEEFEIGRVYRHPFTRTVTEADNVLFTSLTMNLQPLHLDHEFARTTPHGRPLFNSLFTLALVGGFHVLELTFGTTLGNLGYDSVTFPNPVFAGDTLRGETTVLDKRESRSRTDSGIVRFEHRGYNQRDELVVTCTRAGLMAKSPENGGSIPALDTPGASSRSDGVLAGLPLPTAAPERQNP
jgi:acyl dehydratase